LLVRRRRLRPGLRWLRHRLDGGTRRREHDALRLCHRRRLAPPSPLATGSQPLEIAAHGFAHLSLVTLLGHARSVPHRAVVSCPDGRALGASRDLEHPNDYAGIAIEGSRAAHGHAEIAPVPPEQDRPMLRRLEPREQGRPRARDGPAAVEEVLTPDVVLRLPGGCGRPARSARMVREVRAARDDVRLRAGSVGKGPRPAQRAHPGMTSRPVDQAAHRALLKLRRSAHIVCAVAGCCGREIRTPRRRRRAGGRGRDDREDHGRRRCEQRGPHRGKANAGCGSMRGQPPLSSSAQPVANMATGRVVRCAGARERSHLYLPIARSVVGDAPKSTANDCVTEAGFVRTGYDVAP
jgi:hypothetical protein